MRSPLHLVGTSHEGHLIMRGVYELHATHGLPLVIVLDAMWTKGMLPDWCDLIAEMLLAGSPAHHVEASLLDAACDAGYPDNMRDVIKARLQELFGLIRTMPAIAAVIALKRASASLVQPAA